MVLVTKSKLKAGLGEKSKKGSDLESKAVQEPKLLRTGLKSKTSVGIGVSSLAHVRAAAARFGTPPPTRTARRASRRLETVVTPRVPSRRILNERPSFGISKEV
ncbi:hypothetical protein EVAR_41123_1 [Eumeta japonica]|uniref:Uncharacterized protein n=1 Tax=Eumeta variegata TaxID=151549 RepID=A0A4C1XEC8_EUMVA|nr:hypothetical protein EVAR_41123_1 [Eumeta japonica]